IVVEVTIVIRSGQSNHGLEESGALTDLRRILETYLRTAVSEITRAPHHEVRIHDREILRDQVRGLAGKKRDLIPLQGCVGVTHAKVFARFRTAGDQVVEVNFHLSAGLRAPKRLDFGTCEIQSKA